MAQGVAMARKAIASTADRRTVILVSICIIPA
jgi:hypothetical protein